MHLSLLTPEAALIVLAAVPALFAAQRADTRARTVRRRLVLPEPGRRSLATTMGAIAAVGVLVGLSAAQPVLARSSSHRVRADAEALLVFDVSRSMEASAGPGSPTRLERAQAFARVLHARLQDVPTGVASVTDRVLPYIFPSGNFDAVEETIDQCVTVGNPPPKREIATQATQFGALARLTTTNFFLLSEKKRLVIVLTDGESLPFAPRVLGTALGKTDGLYSIFVHFWRPDEQVFTNGVPEASYRSDPNSGATIAALGEATHGLAADESQLDRVVSASRTFLGSGETVPGSSKRDTLALAPLSLLVALVPLGVLLRRRVF